MIYQIDPLASTVALIALGVSIWAVVVAKREPHRARTRSTRDSVRDLLLDARRAMDQLTDALDSGRDVPDDVASLEAACESLRVLGPRLPEADTIDAIWGWLKFVNSFWREVLHREASVERARVSRRRAADGLDATVVAKYDDNIETMIRTRDAARVNLREKMATARDRMDGYLARLDAADRGRREI